MSAIVGTTVAAAAKSASTTNTGQFRRATRAARRRRPASCALDGARLGGGGSGTSACSATGDWSDERVWGRGEVELSVGVSAGDEVVVESGSVALASLVTWVTRLSGDHSARGGAARKLHLAGHARCEHSQTGRKHTAPIRRRVRRPPR